MKSLCQLFVSDIKKAKKWYAQMLGAKIVHEYPKFKCALISIGGAEIDMGQPIANWELNWKAAKKLVGKQIGYLLLVKDVKAEYARLKKKGVRFIVKPRKVHWAKLVADFKDFDGNTWRLIE
jgi:uncharacterized glyoxalase superfamily protein PhnB